MSKSPLYAHILLDRSGSMENCRDTTIDAVNEYVMGMRRSDTIDARLSLTTFDSESIDSVAHLEPAASFPELSRRTYAPRAMTPLLDAIGKVVAEMDKAKLRPDEKVALTIVTDGAENASKEYKLADIRALLEGRQKDKGWLVTFLGADVDAFAEAAALGVGKDKYLHLKKQHLRESMAFAAASQSRYVETGDLAAGDFTREEQARAAKD